MGGWGRNPSQPKTEGETEAFALIFFASHECNPLVLSPRISNFPFLTQPLSLVRREKCWLREKGSSPPPKTPEEKPAALPVPSVFSSEESHGWASAHQLLPSAAV